MKQKFIIKEFPKDWENLSPVMKRHAVITRDGGYFGSFVTVSNDNNTWFVGLYNLQPFINYTTGNTFIKCICINSGTFKNGKFYGTMSPVQMLQSLSERIPQFEFVKSILIYLPNYVITAILLGKITSQEAAWKLVAKRSYHDAHWKLVRLCKMNGISFNQLRFACHDWEAFNTKKITRNYEFERLVADAVILNEKISCQWSKSRVSNELSRMNRKLTDMKIAMLPDTKAWLDDIELPENWEMVNTEKEAFFVSDFFNNCVHRCYWSKIRQHRYVVFYNIKEELCIGYQIINDGEDVLFDQIHGKLNSSVDPEIRNNITFLLRPLAQQLADCSKSLLKVENKQNNDECLEIF